MFFSNCSGVRFPKASLANYGDKFHSNSIGNDVTCENIVAFGKRTTGQDSSHVDFLRIFFNMSSAKIV